MEAGKFSFKSRQTQKNLVGSSKYAYFSCSCHCSSAGMGSGSTSIGGHTGMTGGGCKSLIGLLFSVSTDLKRCHFQPKLHNNDSSEMKMGPIIYTSL
jgi:hypothetical protein